MMLTQQQLIHQIMDAAREMGEQENMQISVEYSSVANHLRITARNGWLYVPVIDECIELHKSFDHEFVKRRVCARLTEIANKLDSMLFQMPRPAA